MFEAPWRASGGGMARPLRQAELCCPPCVTFAHSAHLVNRHLRSEHRSKLGALGAQVGVGEVVVVAAAHLAHHKQVGADRALLLGQRRVVVGRPLIHRLSGA
eukprot:scaffold31707_cov124-Isochrysis_galbana.AAC.7